MSQQWTSVNVPWNTQYLDDVFTFTLAKKCSVVLVLSQPDERYFSGLEGRYRFGLHFRLYKEGEDTYIVRSMLGTGSGRSCSAELELEPGNYSVHIKIETGRRDDASTAEEMIKKYRQDRRDKLFAVGRNFDGPNAKGRLREREVKNEQERKAAVRKEEREELKRQRGYKRIERGREKARSHRIQAEIKRKSEAKKAERKKEREEKQAAKATTEAANEKESDAPKSATEPLAIASDASTSGAEKKLEEGPSAEMAKDVKQETLPTPESTTSGTTPSTAQPTPESDKSGEKEETKDKAEVSDEVKPEVQAAVVEKPDDAQKEGAEDGMKDPGPESEEEEGVSEVSSVVDDDFSWDSDVDGFADIETDEEQEPGMYANDPWNATCVIGLRVYSLDKDTKVKVQEGKPA